eukprot:g6020.t1 g6020   contig20:629006-629356(+)
MASSSFGGSMFASPPFDPRGGGGGSSGGGGARGYSFLMRYQQEQMQQEERDAEMEMSRFNTQYDDDLATPTVAERMAMYATPREQSVGSTSGEEQAGSTPRQSVRRGTRRRRGEEV